VHLWKTVSLQRASVALAVLYARLWNPHLWTPLASIYAFWLSKWAHARPQPLLRALVASLFWDTSGLVDFGVVSIFMCCSSLDSVIAMMENSWPATSPAELVRINSSPAPVVENWGI